MPGKTSHPLSAIAPPTILTAPQLHPNHKEIDHHVISYLVNTWEWPSEKAKQGFISWKLSEVVLFMFSTGNTTRVQLACELLLLGFLMDDWFDNNTFETNTALVSRLNALLTSPSTFSPETNIETMHTTLFRRILAATTPSLPEAPTAILTTYMHMLACHCDVSRGEATSFREYLVFREVDVGMPICRELLYWTEDLALTNEDKKLLAPLERVANYHVSILNDIFSFDREWKAAETLGQGAVLVNGVRILADEAAVSVGTAKRLCFAFVRAWEVEFKRMVDETLEGVGGMEGERLQRAVVGIERRMSGAEAFSWRTKRYL
ncbi:hypothetical protein OQA88_2632 [Cercophora sp. LCS_1]